MSGFEVTNLKPGASSMNLNPPSIGFGSPADRPNAATGSSRPNPVMPPAAIAPRRKNCCREYPSTASLPMRISPIFAPSGTRCKWTTGLDAGCFDDEVGGEAEHQPGQDEPGHE